MNLSPDTTVTIPLSLACERAPLLLSNVQSLTRCTQVEPGRFTPVVCRLSESADDASALTGLLNAEQLRRPGALVILPEAADDYIDALLEEQFFPMTTTYEGLMKCMAVYALIDDVSGVAFEMSALSKLGEDEFILAVVCNDKLRLRRISNQPPMSDDELQGTCFSADNYRPYRMYFREEVDEAAQKEREDSGAPYWLVREVVLLNRRSQRPDSA
ncbi:hypothetical protein [Variovorax sp. Sphag1AA]|uniref:hypothetical protein n=1 Tax=Variovorax sp. Sphag1AA TaxID=2587027 RepID=UPI001621A17F|nr:hypothetical protein [Variovorax sp. Sphag1AA]MBB3181158.1 hypothetical protein [Variovorax sp. Sphag1AA]